MLQRQRQNFASAPMKDATHTGYPRPEEEQVRAWFLDLFGGHTGWMELGYVYGDPNEVDLTIAGWHWYSPDNVDTLVEHCCDLVEQYGNAYHRVSLLSQKRRKEDAVSFIPGIFGDDYSSGAALPATDLLESSQDNFQAYWRVEGGIDVATYKELSTRLESQAGFSSNSKNAIHFVRFPGSINTKAGRNNFVARHHRDPTVRLYTVKQLRSAFPKAKREKLPGARKSGAEYVADLPPETRKSINYWRANIGMLLNDEGLPELLTNPETHAYKILKGELKEIDGDSSSSMHRASVMSGLVGHGYPQAEAIALAMCLVPPAKHKSEQWLLGDAARLFDKYRKKLDKEYKPTDIHSDAESDACNNRTEPAPARTHGRPVVYTFTADDLLQWMKENGNGAKCTVFGTRAEHAIQIDISGHKLRRLEDELARTGRAVRKTHRHASWLELTVPQEVPESIDSGMSKNASGSEMQEPAAPEPQPAECAVTAGETEARAVEPGDSRVSKNIVAEEISESGIATTENDEAKHNARNAREIENTPPLLDGGAGALVCLHDASAVPDTCTAPRTYQDAVRAVLEKHPRAKRAVLLDTVESLGFPNRNAIAYWLDRIKQEQRWKRQVEKIRQMTLAHTNRAITIAEGAIAAGIKLNASEQKRNAVAFWRWRYMMLVEHRDELLAAQKQRESVPIDQSEFDQDKSAGEACSAKRTIPYPQSPAPPPAPTSAPPDT